MNGKLKILYISVEVSPYAKVGGLADVAGSLPKALRALGHDVRIAMPAYKMVESDKRWGFKTLKRSFSVKINKHWTKKAYLKESALAGVPVYLLGTDEWFNLADRSDRVYLPGYEQYLFFARGILAACKAIGWIPDVIHGNDWHCGAIPAVARAGGDPTWDETAIAYTIHNLAYQGVFGPEVVEKAGLPMSLFNMHQLETWGAFNFLKSGVVFADQVNTVSERYAKEIQTPQFGCTLEGLMKHLWDTGRLNGILNGIDTDRFNPMTDPAIAAHFGPGNLAGKAKCRNALIEELGFSKKTKSPIAGVVSRLSDQKGMDLMLQVAEQTFDLPMRMVVLGQGDPWLADRFRELEHRYPKSFRFINAFDVDLAQRIYAGSDMFLMPSAFEPCGLGQLIALRYGTIPVVRRTGGLADTVFEGKNGFVFDHKDAVAYLDTLNRACQAWSDEAKWTRLVEGALAGDYGWGPSALRYVDMYQRALKSRRNVKAALAS